jgi:hypothetical protein
MISEDLVGIVVKVFKKIPFPLLTFIVIATAYYIWTWSPILAQLDGDNAIYFMSANIYSPYATPSLVSIYFDSISFYPPMYPLLLGLLGGGNSVLIAHVITTSFLLIAMLTLYCWMINLSFDRTHALVLVLIFSICPGTYFEAMSLHSEILYLLFSLIGICLVTLKENTGNDKLLWIAVIFIACTALTRSAGVSIVMALIIYLVINNVSRKYYLSIIALIPMVVWGLLNNQGSDSYLDILSNYYTTDFIAPLLQQFLNQSVYMLSAWHSTFTLGNSGHIILNVFAIISVLSVFFRIYKKNLDGIYVFLYLCMVMSWPYPDEIMRLLFPIVPILLVQTSIFLKFIDEHWFTSKFPIGNSIVGVTLLIILIPNLLLTASRLNVVVDETIIPPQYKKTYDWYHINLRQAINQVAFNYGIVSSLEDAKNHVPVDECVYSIKPTLVGLYMGRISKTPPGSSFDDNEYFKVTEQENCHYYYLVNATSPSYKESFYPYQRLDTKLELIKMYYSPNNPKIPVSILGKMKE